MPRKGITRRADGRYVSTLTLPNGTRKYVYGDTRKAVLEKVKELEARAAQGADISRKDQTLKDFLTYWLDEVVQPTCKPSTASNYRRIVTQQLIPTLGYMRLSEITPEPIQALINTLARTNAPRSVRNVRAALRRALNIAMQNRHIVYNAAALCVLPRAEKTNIKPLNVDQLHAFFDVIVGHYLEALYHMAVRTGLRQGELLALTWPDVDLDAGTVRVAATLSLVNGKWVRVPPKTESSVRTVPLSSDLILMLKKKKRAKGYVFCTRNGTPIAPRNLVRQFKELLEKAGLPRSTRFHDLRHTCATLLIANGENPRMVMQHLGHTQISTTMDIYGHVFDADHRVAVDKLDNMLKPKDGEVTRRVVKTVVKRRKQGKKKAR